MLVYAAAALIVFATLYVTLTKGIAHACVWVYLPVALFFICMPAIALSGIPDMSSVGAIGYGVLLSLFIKRDDLLKLKFNVIDAVVLAILGAAIVSTVLSEGAWGGVSATGKESFVWILPYLFGRMVTTDGDARRGCVKVLCVCAVILGCFAVLEARLIPFAYSRWMEQTGLVKVTNTQTMPRFGFTRAQVSTPHPIDLGNVGVLLGAAILALAPTVGRKLRSPLVIAGVCGAGLMVGGAISFTCFLGLAAAGGMYAVFSRATWGARLVAPSMVLIILALVSATSYLLTVDTEIRPEAGSAESSLWMRTVIVQGSWDVASTAGAFGWGKKLPGDRIGVGSIDNAYMLFAMRRGWVYLTLWGVLALTAAFKAGAALRRATSVSERLPVAAAVAGIMATLVAMYTVWYGFLYAQMFVFLLGILASLCQLLAYRAAAAAPTLYTPSYSIAAGTYAGSMG